MRYRTYDPRVKQMIISSGNPNLFPDLKIPRTTALYWIHRRKDSGEKPARFEAFSETDILRRENFKLKAKKLFLKEIIQAGFGVELRNSLKGKERREKIVNLIESFQDILILSEMLTTLGISFSTYYRYRSEIRGCPISQNKCDSSYGRSLSHKDQQKMIDLALDKRFAHFSTRSLAYYAQREGFLSCGIDSWYKYLKLNKIQRTYFVKKEPKYYGKGIRATRPHELWHIDVTEVKTKNFQKLYLQLIVDNYSRAIIRFRVGLKKDLSLSLRSLRGLNHISENVEQFLLSDGGRENVNHKVEKVLIGKNITHLVALSDVSFSNSIVEAVFRQIKRMPEVRHPKSLHTFKNAIEKYVSDHNTVIPHSAHKGATPFEVLQGDVECLNYKSRVMSFHESRMDEKSVEKERCRRCVRSASMVSLMK